MATATKKVKSQIGLPKKIRDYEKVVDFDPKFKWADLPVTFSAESYSKWLLETLPSVVDMKPQVVLKRANATKVGKWYYYLLKFPIWHYSSPGFMLAPRPCRSALQVFRGVTSRDIKFDGLVSIPVLADVNKSPWMSLTPNEIFTQRGQIRRARGDVGISGLGMGWSARKVLERKQVKHLTVYEKDKDILEYFGKPLLDEYGDRLKLVCADAYEVDYSDHDSVLWDIWKGWGSASSDRRYLKIRDKLRKDDIVCVGWGEGVYRD